MTGREAAVAASDNRASPKQKLFQKIRENRTLVQFYEGLSYMRRNPKTARRVIRIFFARLFSGKKMIAIMAAPSHGNRGDHMIVFGMRKFCEKYFPSCRLEEFDDSIVKQRSFLSLLKIALRKDDFVFLRGGGSVGDWYIHYEYFIRHLLERYVKYRVVMFPQSVFFSDTPQGNLEKDLTAHAYDTHPRFLINTRDEKSFETAQEMFSHAKVRLCPDIAMLLFTEFRQSEQERSGVLLCLRPDRNEMFYTDTQREALTAALAGRYELKYGDTSAGHDIAAAARQAEIEELLHRYSSSRVSVCDRFHGVIASVLTGTPCVAMRSADHKITAGIKWFKDLDYVFFAQDIEDVPALVERAMRCEKCAVPDFSPYFDELFRAVNDL